MRRTLVTLTLSAIAVLGTGLTTSGATTIPTQGIMGSCCTSNN